MIIVRIRPLDRSIVIDKTGLTGKYDIRLNWTPDDNQSLAAAPPGPNAPNAAPLPWVSLR
jgi:uncharacterized protein (TIGR03435 family)